MRHRLIQVKLAGFISVKEEVCSFIFSRDSSLPCRLSRAAETPCRVHLSAPVMATLLTPEWPPYVDLDTHPLLLPIPFPFPHLSFLCSYIVSPPAPSLPPSPSFSFNTRTHTHTQSSSITREALKLINYVHQAAGKQDKKKLHTKKNN